MTDRELLDRIKKNNLGGAYLFYGEEDYLKRYYLGALRRAVITDDTFATFNHLVLDGKDGTLGAVLDAIKAPPMFEDYKLIEWRYAPLGSMKEAELTELEEVLDALSEYEYAVLAMIIDVDEVDMGTEKRPSKFARRFKDKINMLAFPKSKESDLLAWLKRHFNEEGITVSRESLEMLLFRSGRSMEVLNLEVEKLAAYLKANSREVLTSEDVLYVASPSPEFDTFALSNAVIERNKAAAIAALGELKKERVDPTVIIGMLAKTYSELVSVSLMLRDGMSKEAIEEKSGLHKFKVQNYIRAARLYRPPSPVSILEELSRVDVSSKWGGVSGYTAIEIFISKCV